MVEVESRDVAAKPRRQLGFFLRLGLTQQRAGAAWPSSSSIRWAARSKA